MQSANSKRAMSKKSAIENEIARHKKAAEDVITKSECCFTLAMTLPFALGNVVHQSVVQIRAMQQIPHWCFRKNRPELEPRLYNRWLKSQAKAGVRVIAGK